MFLEKKKRKEKCSLFSGMLEYENPLLYTDGSVRVRSVLFFWINLKRSSEFLIPMCIDVSATRLRLRLRRLRRRLRSDDNIDYPMGTCRDLWTPPTRGSQRAVNDARLVQMRVHLPRPSMHLPCRVRARIARVRISSSSSLSLSSSLSIMHMRNECSRIVESRGEIAYVEYMCTSGHSTRSLCSWISIVTRVFVQFE